MNRRNLLGLVFLGLLVFSGVPFLYIGGVQEAKAVFEEVSTLTAGLGENYASAMAAYNGYLYVATTGYPSKILKIRLSDFYEVCILNLNLGYDKVNVVQRVGDFLYVATDTSPAKIAKVDLTSFTQVGGLTLNTGENQGSAIAYSGDVLYVGTWTSPAKIVRINLVDFTRMDSLTLSPGEDKARTINVYGDYIYVGTYSIPAHVVRIRISDFSYLNTLNFGVGENNIEGSGLDGSIAYYSLYDSGGVGKLVKVDLSAFQKLSVITLSERYPAAVNIKDNYIYVGVYNTPSKVIKVDKTAFAEVDKLTCNEGEDKNEPSVIYGSYLYLGMNTAPAKIVKVRIAIGFLAMDGFESGDFSNWSGTFTTSGETATVESAAAYDGVYGGNFTGSGDGGWEGAYSYVTIPSSYELYARGYFRVESSGLTDDGDRFFFMIFMAGGNPVAYAGWWRVDGVVKWALLMRDGIGWALAFSDSSPVVGQWYSVELHWAANAVAGSGELYVNGEVVSSITGKDTTAFGWVDQIRFGLAELSYCDATTVYGDSFVLSDAYVGPALLVDGFESGDFSRWSGTLATSGEATTVVDTVSHDGTYSGNFSSDGNGGFEFSYGYVTTPTLQELYARGYVGVATSGLTDDDDRFFSMMFLAGGEPVAYAGWWRVGGVVRWSLLMRDGSGWALAFSESSPALNQWYSVELHWVSDSVAGLGELYVNGELVCSISGINTATFGDVDLIRFGLAELYNCGATTVYGDSFAASEAYVGPEP